MYRKIGLGSACVAALICSSGARAQTAVERNLPPAPVAPAAPIPQPDVVPASQDDTPLGADLKAIVLLGDGVQPLATGVAPTGEVQLIGLPQLDRPQVVRALSRFVGRPLSRKLIAQIQAEIARQARTLNRPFVSLSVPAQEITNGAIQIRVTEFRVGKVDVKGVGQAEGDSIRDRIRVARGETVDAATLSEDLDWINRSPFRDSSALFAPGAAVGETDLTLSAKARRPYRLFGGWTNTGSQSTGTDRYYVGMIRKLPVLRDSYISYQITGSSDFWEKDGSWFRNQPRYVSQGLRVYVPTYSRQNLEFTLSDALTNQKINADFAVRQRMTEATLGYRTALSEIGLPAGSGDLLLAVEGKRQHRQVYFGTINIIDQTADLWQGLVGWSKVWQEPGTRFSTSVNVHMRPGDVSESSTVRRLAAISNGRITADRYAYVDFDISGMTRLPKGFALSTGLSMRYAGTALPLAAQIGLGGDGLVRGYTPDDGSFDAGIVSRNELRLPTFSLAGGPDAFRTTVAPFVFVDVGYGRDRASRTRSSLASAGVGADYAFGRYFSAGLNSAWALKDGQRTRGGDWQIRGRITLNY
jgi:hemolysin activation/secretion protein